MEQAIIKLYASKKAEPGPEQQLIFKDTKITLDIPKEGHTVCDGWKVFPVMSPQVNHTCMHGLIWLNCKPCTHVQIEKKIVDEHSPENQLIVPHCELKAKWVKGAEQLKPLEYIINILGTTDEEKFFTINIDPGLMQIEASSSLQVSFKFIIMIIIMYCMFLMLCSAFRCSSLASTSFFRWC